MRGRVVSESDEVHRWMAILTKKNLYEGISDILHFALCCFMKSPLEAVAESKGSEINSHGNENRSSLLLSSLSNEVQLSWNGPQEFDPTTDTIIDESIEKYFEENSMGVRFYVRSKLNIMSSTSLQLCGPRNRYAREIN